MNKQLTQEQIDSLNAIYAKMEDDSLELEFLAHSEWLPSNDQGNDIKSRVQNIMICNTPYRIKPEAPKKEYCVVGATELPAPSQKETHKYVQGDGWEVTCTLRFKNKEDASSWFNFLFDLSHHRNTIEK